MSTQPQWEAVDNDTADLLSLVATGPLSTGTAEREWVYFLDALASASLRRGDDLIHPNDLRELTRGVVAPQRCGAFVSKAARGGPIVADGWDVSNDLEGGNGGKPARRYRLTDLAGGQARSGVTAAAKGGAVVKPTPGDGTSSTT